VSTRKQGGVVGGERLFLRFHIRRQPDVPHVIQHHAQADVIGDKPGNKNQKEDDRCLDTVVIKRTADAGITLVKHEEQQGHGAQLRNGSGVQFRKGVAQTPGKKRQRTGNAATVPSNTASV
jgi:hypothetical protein